MPIVATVAIGGPGIWPGNRCPVHACDPLCTYNTDTNAVDHTDWCDRTRRMLKDGGTPSKVIGAHRYPETYVGVSASSIRDLFGPGTFSLTVPRWQDELRASRHEAARTGLQLGRAIQDAVHIAIATDAMIALGADYVEAAAGESGTPAEVGAALVRATLPWGIVAPSAAFTAMTKSAEGLAILRARKRADDALLLDQLTDDAFSRYGTLLATVQALGQDVDTSDGYLAAKASAVTAAAAIDDVRFDLSPAGAWVVDGLVWGPDDVTATAARLSLGPAMPMYVEALSTYFYIVADLKQSSRTELALAVAERRMLGDDNPYPEALKVMEADGLSAMATASFNAVMILGCTAVAVGWADVFFVAKAPDGTTLQKAVRALDNLKPVYRIVGTPSQYSTHELRRAVWGAACNPQPALWSLNGCLDNDDHAYVIDTPDVCPHTEKILYPNKSEIARRQVNYCLELLRRALKIYGLHYMSIGDPKKPTMAQLDVLGVINTQFTNVHPADTHPTELHLRDAMLLGLALKPSFKCPADLVAKALGQILSPNSICKAKLGLDELRSAYVSKGIWVFGPPFHQTCFEPLAAFHAARVVQKELGDGTSDERSTAVMSILFGERLGNIDNGVVLEAIRTGVGPEGRRVRCFYDRKERPNIVFDRQRVRASLQLGEYVKARFLEGRSYLDWTQGHHITAPATQRVALTPHDDSEDVYRTAAGHIASTAREVDRGRLTEDEDNVFVKACFSVAALAGMTMMPRLYLRGLYESRVILLYGVAGSGKSTWTGMCTNWNRPDVTVPVDGSHQNNQFSAGIAGLDPNGMAGSNGRAHMHVPDSNNNAITHYYSKADAFGESPEKIIEIKNNPFPAVLGGTDDSAFVDPVMANRRRPTTGVQKSTRDRQFSNQVTAYLTRVTLNANSFRPLFPDSLLGGPGFPLERAGQIAAWERRCLAIKCRKLHAGGMNSAIDSWMRLEVIEAFEDGLLAHLAAGQAIQLMEEAKISDLVDLHKFPCAAHGFGGDCPDGCTERKSWLGCHNALSFEALSSPPVTGPLGTAVRCLQAHFMVRHGVATAASAFKDAMSTFDPQPEFTMDIISQAVQIVFGRRFVSGRAAGVGLCTGAYDAATCTYECRCTADGELDGGIHKHTFKPGIGNHACCAAATRYGGQVLLGVRKNPLRPVAAELA